MSSRPLKRYMCFTAVKEKSDAKKPRNKGKRKNKRGDLGENQGNGANLPTVFRSRRGEAKEG